MSATGAGDAFARRPGPEGGRARLWAVLAALPVFAGLTALGDWQLDRLAWKTALLARIAQAEQAPPVVLGASLPEPWTRLVATGRFDHAREALLGLEVQGGTLGAHLIVPLMRAGAPPVLVDRGWVPLERAAPITRPEAELAVVGWARAAEPRSAVAARDDVAGRRFYTFDPGTIATALDLPDAMPFALVALGPPGPVPPIPTRALPRPNNPHLGYAITWFGLAAALVGVVLAFALRRRPGRDVLPEESP